MNKYLLKPKKQNYYLEDENNEIVYEANITKFSIFSASTYNFINHKSSKTEEHKIGKTITIEQNNNSFTDILSTRSYFKYDGKKIWDYLHEMGIRIDSNISNRKLGMTYQITLEGKELATISTSSPKGKSLITTSVFLDVICEEKNLDLAFLVAFSIAKTEQLFYN